MSIDGANLGIKPHRVLETMLGGKPSPKEDEMMSREDMLKQILAMPDDYKTAATSYDNSSMWLAKQFYLLRKEGKEGDQSEMYDFMKDKNGDKEKDYDFTGFMVGWANNVSRWLLDRPEVGNDAILELKI